MGLPPPLSDPAHIETRLLVVAEMLEKAVAEVRRTMVEVREDFETRSLASVEDYLGGPPDAAPSDDQIRRTDGNT